MSSKRDSAFSLIELIVVVAVMAVMATVIITMVYDLVGTGRTSTEKRNIQLWNQSYVDAFAAGATDITSANDWGTASSRLAAGVTADLGNSNVTFACLPPVFINSGNPTFERGRGITAAP
ncbi:MAG: prepilin-type N-terminal cleavage/methylation domain-containing protein [Opitutales bacterium]